MSKGLITTLVILGVIVILIFWMFGAYNGLVDKQEAVERDWSNVENQYQRRADLIPNLVSTVNGYANFEQETLREVIEARSKATAVNVDAGNLTPDKVAQFQQAQEGLTSALSRLLVVVEKYPDLKANENFLQLQAQLEGTENRITVARNRFNETANSYNASIRKFPGAMIAGMFGFERKGYFEASEGAEKAPTVSFD
jgi:LemA protein